MWLENLWGSNENKKEQLRKEETKQELLENIKTKDHPEVSELKYLQNKDELLALWEKFKITHWVSSLINFLEQEKYEYFIDEYGFVAQVKFWDKVKNIFWHDYWFNNSSSLKLFSDKVYTNKILRRNWIKCPKELFLMKKDNPIFISNWDYYNSIENFVSEIGFPLIVKPIDQSRGKWVEKIFNKQELDIFLEIFNNDQKIWEKYVIQEFISGSDYRIVYLAWEILIAYKREAVSITWDGNKSIKQLLLKQNIPEKIFPHILEYLSQKEIKTSHILKTWENLELLPVSNISTWWVATIHNLSSQDIDFVKKIPKILWSEYFWLDVITDSHIEDWAVIEVNGTPWVAGVFSQHPELKKDYFTKIWKQFKKI